MIDYTAVKKALAAELQSITGTIEARTEIATQHLQMYKAFKSDIKELIKRRRMCELSLRALSSPGATPFARAVAGDLAAIDSNRENER